MTTHEITLSDQVKKIPQATRPIVEAAIETVKEAAPKADEVTYRTEKPRAGSRMMWKIVRYAVDGENVIGVATFSEHATLVFYRGRDLNDSSGLLQGSGKPSQYITFRSQAAADNPQ